MNTEGHIGELELRRRRAGETLGADAATIEAHAAVCAECKARIRALDDEQRRFEAAISFDRFAAGVERAARGPRAVPRRAAIRSWMVIPTLAMAAAVAVIVTFHGPSRAPGRVHPAGYDGIKGGAGMMVRVAGAAGQRTARVDGTEPLSAGERLRIGYQTGGHRYLLSLSIDEHGEVTPLYPEQGGSLTVPAGV
ncbi:MAG TPA: ACP synthase, partial [Polyangia bacterium]|nr:ACP synthase [Polyangia bacterium]